MPQSPETISSVIEIDRPHTTNNLDSIHSTIAKDHDGTWHQNGLFVQHEPFAVYNFDADAIIPCDKLEKRELALRALTLTGANIVQLSLAEGGLFGAMDAHDEAQLADPVAGIVFSRTSGSQLWKLHYPGSVHNPKALVGFSEAVIAQLHAKISNAN